MTWSAITPSLEQLPDLQHLPTAARRFFEKNRVASANFKRMAPQRSEWIGNHTFRLKAVACSDGRMNDFWLAIDTYAGILEMRRTVGGILDPSDYAYNLEGWQGVERAERTEVNGMTQAKAIMQFLTVHYSHSNPLSGCLKRKNQTQSGLEDAQRNTAYLHEAYPGSVVALPILVDTDLDAIVVVGPKGRLGTRELLDDSRMEGGNGYAHVVDLLRKIIPTNWEPLTRLSSPFRVRFHEELAERVVGNLAFVRSVIKSKRPIETAEHKEQIILVGRHADWITETNTAFLIDDRETKEQLFESFEIGLLCCAKTAILEAIKAGDREWCIPVIVNIPHDGEKDEPVSKAYVRRLVQLRLSEKLRRSAPSILARIMSKEDGLGNTKLPGWLQTSLATFVDRVVFIMSVSRRDRRLFVPFA